MVLEYIYSCIRYINYISFDVCVKIIYGTCTVYLNYGLYAVHIAATGKRIGVG